MKAEKTRKKLHDWANMLFTSKYATDSINAVIGELEIIEGQADKWVEKETPYIVVDFKTDMYKRKIGGCKCNAPVTEGDSYCWNCGQRINWEEAE